MADIQSSISQLNTAVKICEQNQKEQLRVSNDTQRAMQKHLNETLDKLRRAGGELERKTSQALVLENKLANKEREFREMMADKQRSIQMLNNSISAQRPIVARVEQIKTEIENKNGQIQKMREEKKRMDENFALLRKDEREARGRMSEELKNSFKVERAKLIDGHASDMRKQQMAMAELNSKMENVSSRLKQSESIRGKLGAEIRAAMDKMARVQSEMTDKVIAGTNREVELKTKMSEVMTESDLLRQRFLECKATRVQVEKERDQIRAKMDAFTARSNKDMADLAASLNRLKIESQDKMQRNDQLFKASLENAEQKNKAQMTDLQVRLKAAQDEIGTLKKQQADNAKLINYSTQRTQRKIDEAVAKYVKEVDQGSAEINRLRDAVERAQKEKSGLMDRMSAMESDLRKTREEANACQYQAIEEKRAYEKNMDSLRSRLAFANKLAQERADKITDSEKKMFQLSTECDTTRRAQADALKQLSDCKKNGDSCSARVLKLNDTLERLTNDLSTSRASEKQREVGMQTCQREFLTTKNMLKKQEDATASARRTVKEMETKVALLDDRVRNLMMDLQRETRVRGDKSAALDQMRKVVNDLNEKKADIELQKAKMVDEMDKMRLQEKAQMASINTLNAQVAKLQSALANSTKDQDTALRAQSQECSSRRAQADSLHRAEMKKQEESFNQRSRDQMKDYERRLRERDAQVQKARSGLAKSRQSIERLASTVDSYRSKSEQNIRQGVEMQSQEALKWSQRLSDNLKRFENEDKRIKGELDNVDAQLLSTM